MASSTAAVETQYAEIFREFVRSEQNARLSALRKEAFAVFSQKGFPTPRQEDWKYTNVSSVDSGKWIVDSSPASIPEVGVELLSKFNFERNGFAALNLAFADVKVIRIAKNSAEDKPVVLAYGGEDGRATFPHIVVIVETGSEATLIETYSSEAASFTDTAIQIVIEDNARLTHYRVQKESPEAFNYGITEVTLCRDASYNSTNVNLGGRLSRHDIELKFTAEGGEAWVDGLYMIGGSQHHDTHSIIDHQVPNCISHQNYKGVLNDKSRAVFNGKVFVRENAHGTDAQQQNKNLLLSNEARVDTKPQLEIFNDDVKCSHGATVGQLEEEELFYLLTRGLPENLAKNLLTYGFAEEVISKIGIESIKSELDEAVLNRLNVKLEV